MTLHCPEAFPAFKAGNVFFFESRLRIDGRLRRGFVRLRADLLQTGMNAVDEVGDIGNGNLVSGYMRGHDTRRHLQH